MEFDVAPQPLRQRGWRRAVGVAGGAIAIVAFALVMADTPATPPDGSPLALAVDAAPQAGSLPTQIAHATSTPVIAPGMPAQDAIVCRGLDQVTCGQVARASIATLTTADGPVTRIAVSPSLLCNDDVACPAATIADAQPLGSAVVSLGSGAQAWINVVGPAPGSGRAWEPARTTAWIVRWLP